MENFQDFRMFHFPSKISAIRGGDYYLFESEGVDEHDKTAVTSLTFGTDTEGHTEGPNPLQVTLQC